MKRRRNLILTILIAALLVGLLVWRLWPRSLESLSGLELDQAIALSAHARTTDYKSGMPVFVSYRMDDEDTLRGTEHFDPLLTLFRDIKARPSLTNLLRPWAISGSSWTGPVDFLYGFVSCGDTGCNFELTNRGELLIGSRLYFITDEEQFTALWDYVTTHGFENRS